MVTVPAGQKRVVDLYFPLPASAARERRLPAFGTIWSVHTPRGTSTERTEFDRVDVLPPPDAYLNDNGDTYWGSPYWYNPYYYSAPFYPPR